MSESNELKQKIYPAIARVMGKISAIGKDHKNMQQNYSYRGIDDVYNMLQPLFAEEQLVIIPNVIDVKRETHQSAKGSNLLYTIVTVRYTILHADGSKIDSVVCGEGMDTGDKSLNKALAGAQKYWALQTFLIPTEESKDSENDSPEIANKLNLPKNDGQKIIPEQSHSIGKITPENAKYLRAQCRLRGINESDIISWLSSHVPNIKTIDDIPGSNEWFEKVKKSIIKKPLIKQQPLPEDGLPF
jgi:hypothetical protein